MNDIKAISMNHVSFSYHDDSDKVLDNISFDTFGKENICFIGENGQGKSTIIKLLMGLFDDYNGDIQINGTDVREIDTESLFSIVPQDVVILTGTIKDNILFGKIATDDDMTNRRKARLFFSASIGDAVFLLLDSPDKFVVDSNALFLSLSGAFSISAMFAFSVARSVS